GTGGTADVNAEEIPGHQRTLLLVRAIEPAEIHVCVGCAHLQHHFAARFQPIFQRQQAYTIGVVRVLAAAPESAADFAPFATRVTRVTETKVVRAGDVFRLVRHAIP